MAPITTLLIANRGEIVARIARTARRMGIRPVGVYSDPDRSSPALDVLDAAVHIPGVTAADTYLDIEALLTAAGRLGADAVHPGYGFLAERAAFARTVLDAGLTWVGPAPETIEEMGDKVRAREIAAAAGVPVLAAVTVDEGLKPDRVAAAVGFPALVKAAAGGGGKGMRIVRDPEALAAALESAAGEAERSFGDPTVFVERYLDPARHVEVQVVGDTQGSMVHLFERECSIQRRHQKIIEESPSPGIGPTDRARLYEAAVRLATSIGYVGAGTVEFVVSAGPEPNDHTLAFIEMNTRLQVEHPVTEELTGIDLVEWQLRIAAGEPLPRSQDEITTDGHAIEARLYAEDAAAGWTPATGQIERYRHGGVAGARYEEAVGDGTVVTPHYDPMLAKVIVHRPTRTETARALAAELDALQIHGPRTNRDFLVATLRHPDFLAGRTPTSFLDHHPDLVAPPMADEVRTAHLAAAVWRRVTDNRADDDLWAFAPTGWRNVSSQRLGLELDDGDAPVTVHYEMPTPRSLVLSIDGGADVGAAVARAAGGDLAVEIEDVRRTVAVRGAGDTIWVDSTGGHSRFTVLPRFPVHDPTVAGGGPTAPVPGTIVSVAVSPGDEIEANDLLVVMEAMKMEHRITAPGPAVVEAVLVAPGDQVDAGAVLVHLGERPVPAQEPPEAAT